MIYLVMDQETKEIKFRTNNKKSAENKCRQLYYNYREQRQFIIKKA